MTATTHAVLGRLEETWGRWWSLSLGAGLARAAALSFAGLAALVLLDALVRLPRAGLVIGALAWAIGSSTMLAMLLTRLLKFRRGSEATARRVELECPEVGSHLINLVQLSGHETDGRADGPADAFREAAAHQAATAVDGFSFDQAAARLSRQRRRALCMQTPRDLAEAIGLLAVVLVIGGLLHATVPGWGSAVRRLSRPWRFVPAVGAVEITKVTPGNAEVRLGASLNVSAEIARASGKKPAGTMFVRSPGGPETARPLAPGPDGTSFAAVVPQVAGPLEYRVEIGDSQSERYRVDVYQVPTIVAVEVAYDGPPYLAATRRALKLAVPDLEGPQGATAALRLTASTPISSGHLQVGDTKVYGRVETDGKTLAVDLTLIDPGTFTVHLVTAKGHTDPSPRVNRLAVQPDAPPGVQLVEPTKDAKAPSGGSMPLAVRADDDHGLGRVRVELKQGGAGVPDDSAVEVVASWDTFADMSTSSLLRGSLALDPNKFAAGTSWMVRAVATDRRSLELPGRSLGPQEMASAWLPLSVIDPKEKARDELARLDDLRSGVAKLLTAQVRARVAAAEAAKMTDAEEAARQASGVRDAQTALLKDASALVAAAGASEDAERQTIKRALARLSTDEMVAAIRQSETLAAATGPAARTEAAGPLMTTQDRVIDVLRRLLDALRRELADLTEEAGARPDSTLPPDVQGKLRDLKDRLEDFLKQQKKVIEASEELAKKPVEDFTDKDSKALADLAAAEDDWSKFLADRHSDLSKLPEQDFANPSMLKEIVDVQTELAMARDALTKKTADIAVPLEQLGAEMAESLTTNIEKWLPDTPDRERWSQEEPLDDSMKTAPMAELPGELEDLVGELMEEEEDLFDELEDMSSSWADSIDKGAGWDAMDGPISNMSARGVTGNRLPNSSEIGGRSGEGRSGKSSGEFVSDTAVGKGGRKTPSRLTPDAFQKGQVKDTSKDPVGGATGGGKQSGFGGEGLQGPVPDRPQDALPRLASKQASLRNKAQGVDLKFRVMQYHHTDLAKLLDQMAAVEADLRAGRYQNALRRRDVLLPSLGQLKDFVDGEFRVRQDRTVNLPTDIQKEVLGSLAEPSPAGWENLNRLYFSRLAETPGAAMPEPKSK
jgi:hypothetical protein